MDRLCDPVLKLCGKFHAEFFCGNGSDVIFYLLNWEFYRLVTNSDFGQSIILPTLTLAVSMAAKYTSSTCHGFGRAEQAVCDGGEGSGNQRKRDHMEKCYESINADNHQLFWPYPSEIFWEEQPLLENIFMWDGVGSWL